MAFLITVLVVALVVGVVLYAISLFPAPAPITNIVKAIVLIIFVLWLLSATFGVGPWAWSPPAHLR